MATVFTVGSAYAATPSMQGARKHMAVVIGRQGNFIQLAWVNDLSLERVTGIYNDREVMSVRRPDGDFTLFAACPLDVANAAEILSMIRHDLDAERRLEEYNG